jgi:hypothetical protein
MSLASLAVATFLGGVYAAVLGADPVAAHDLAGPFTAAELGLWAFVVYRVERHDR